MTGTVLRLVVALLLPQVVGVGSAFATMGAVRDWYPSLVRPSFAPPSWVFGPVWTALYLMMGVAAFLVWQRGLARPDVRLALGLFVAQLVLNGLWSILFFGMRSPGLAFVEIVALWVLIVLTLWTFWRVSPLAGGLLVPYLAWVTFAAALNFGFWWLNRGAG